jgi:hypothetical protein
LGNSSFFKKGVPYHPIQQYPKNIHPKEVKAGSQTDAFTKGKRKSSKYPSVDEWTNKRWDRHHGIVLSLKKER